MLCFRVCCCMDWWRWLWSIWRTTCMGRSHMLFMSNGQTYVRHMWFCSALKMKMCVLWCSAALSSSQAGRRTWRGCLCVVLVCAECERPISACNWRSGRAYGWIGQSNCGRQSRGCEAGNAGRDLDWLHNLIRGISYKKFYGVEAYGMMDFFRLSMESARTAKVMEKFSGLNAVIMNLLLGACYSSWMCPMRCFARVRVMEYALDGWQWVECCLICCFDCEADLE